MRFVYLILLSLLLSCSGSIGSDSHESELKIITNYEFQPFELDTNAILHNSNLDTILARLEKQELKIFAEIEHIPSFMKNQLSVFFPEGNMTFSNIDGPLRYLLSRNEDSIPCRRLRYLGFSEDLLLMSFEYTCRDHIKKAYEYNLIIAEFKQHQLVDVWQGLTPYYFFNDYCCENRTYFVDKLLSRKEDIIRYLKDNKDYDSIIHYQDVVDF